MTYRGHVRSGVVVLGGGARLPEGTVVVVEPVASGRPDEPSETDPLLRILDLAVDTGIPDLGRNIDHDLYDHPRVDDAGE